MVTIKKIQIYVDSCASVINMHCVIEIYIFRSSRPEVFWYQSLFFKVACGTCNLLKTGSDTSVFL